MPPTIAELTNRFLSRPTSTRAGEVEPYDVTSAFRIEPRDAWQETLLVLRCLGLSSTMPMPAEWGAYVRDSAPVRYLPMAFGYYPQMVSDLSILLDNSRTVTDSQLPTLPEFTQIDDSAGVHSANGNALKAWTRGAIDDAISIWSAMPPSVLRDFNLGVAALAQSDSVGAISQLSTACEQLPDDSGWRSLAELYRALAKAEV